jgi:hypothetical protein
MSSKGFYRKVQNAKTGPGGLHCPCCGPAPGRGRRVFFRQSRRVLDRIIKKAEKE